MASPGSPGASQLLEAQAGFNLKAAPGSPEFSPQNDVGYKQPGTYGAGEIGELEPTEEGGEFDDDGIDRQEHLLEDPFAETQQSVLDPVFKDEIVEYLKNRKGRKAQISRISKILSVGEETLRILLENDKDFQVVGEHEVEHVDPKERQAYEDFADHMTNRDDLRFTSFRCDPDKEYDFVHKAATLALKVRPDDVLFVLHQVKKCTMKRPGRTPSGKYPANMPLVLACIVDRIMYLTRKQGKSKARPWALTLGHGLFRTLFDGWVLGVVEGSQFLANMIMTWDRLCYFKREYIRECQDPFWLLIMYSKKEGVPDADKNESKGWYKIVMRPSDELEGCEAIAPPGSVKTPEPPPEPPEPVHETSPPASVQTASPSLQSPAASASTAEASIGSPGSPGSLEPQQSGPPQPGSIESHTTQVPSPQSPTIQSPTIDVENDLGGLKKEDLAFEAIIQGTAASRTPVSPTDAPVPPTPSPASGSSALGLPAQGTPGAQATPGQIANLKLVMQAVGSSAPLHDGSPASATEMPPPESPSESPGSPAPSPASATEQPVPRSPAPFPMTPPAVIPVKASHLEVPSPSEAVEIKKRALEGASEAVSGEHQKGVLLPVKSDSQDEASQPPQKVLRTE